MLARNLSRFGALLLALGLLAVAGCGLDDDEISRDDIDYGYSLRTEALQDFCEISVVGHGTLNVEEEYLAQVVTCEAGEFSNTIEVLKAQAIAARTYAYQVKYDEGRAIQPDQNDQAYECQGRQPTEAARQAVRETSGMILTHSGRVVTPFYVAGEKNLDPDTCQGTNHYANPPINCSTIRARSGTQKYVTYNEHTTGGATQASCLGHPDNVTNRGAMSQNGAACLANKDWKAERILRYFYGDDLRLTKLSGACVGDETDPDLGGGGSVTPPEPPVVDEPGEGEPGDEEPIPPELSCQEDNTGRPTIVSRATWGARAPRANTSPHTPDRITIHHTVTSNEDTNPMATIRMIQSMHMDNPARQYADVGYHFLIDQQGKIYAGRNESRAGAHVLGHNTGNLGIALLGNFETGQPTRVQLLSAARMVRYLGAKYQIDISSSTVKGHRDQGSTACPGTNLYTKLGEIISMAQTTTPPPECTPGADPGESGPREFKYVRVKAVSDEPIGSDDIIDGFELDTALGESADGSEYYFAQSASAEGPVTNAAHATGEPDNDSCDSREQTVAGIQVGGAVILELSQALEAGDKVRVVQGNYHAGLGGCSPSGSAEVAISHNRRDWHVLSHEVSGNAVLTVTLPEPEEPGDGGDGGNGDPQDPPVNTESGNSLADEAGICSREGNGGGAPRCTDGRGGWSDGLGWAYVKAAMIRSGFATRADIDRLAQAVGMAPNDAQGSSAGFKRAADQASDADLARTMGLNRSSLPPSQAPRGSVIAWGPGCQGANAQYGHVEVAMGDGFGCSDFCGELRPDAACASVYIPVSRDD